MSKPIQIEDALVILRSLDNYIEHLQQLKENKNIEFMEGSLDREMERAKNAREKVGNLRIP